MGNKDAAKTNPGGVYYVPLDDCNSLLSGVVNNLVQKIQSVQNAAARLATRTWKCENTKPVLLEVALASR